MLVVWLEGPLSWSACAGKCEFPVQLLKGSQLTVVRWLVSMGVVVVALLTGFVNGWCLVCWWCNLYVGACYHCQWFDVVV